MTDRELLELAAKAIGFGAQNSPDSPHCWTASEYPKGTGKYGALWNYVGYGETAELWNPLADDGDAFRLVVKAELTVYHWPNEICVCNINGTINESIARVGDIYAATRRVIVQAAAEVGRIMK